MSTASTIAPALTHAVPVRTRPAAPSRLETPQHMRALARANQVRLARAALKRRIASGTTGAAEVVLTCPPEAESMTIAELLASQRRWGRARSRKLLNLVDLKENKQLISLTERQRRLLAGALDERTGDCA
jgi:hypothetical protein